MKSNNPELQSILNRLQERNQDIQTGKELSSFYLKINLIQINCEARENDD